MNKRDLVKILSWLFFSSVFIHAIYCGLKFGCWWGAGTAVAGFIGGFIYAKFRKSKCKTL